MIEVMMTETRNVSFYNHNIFTTITKDPDSVETWIDETINNIIPHRPLIIGLDTEWRPSFELGVENENPVAIIQLCTGSRCLIFQFIHAPYIPQSLVDILNNPNYTFTGVGIQVDANKLVKDYGLGRAVRADYSRRLGGNMVDLEQLAVEIYGGDMSGLGLKALATELIGMEPEKPKRVSRSRWDNEWLSPEQIDYASIDAFCSFEIGRVLIQ